MEEGQAQPHGRCRPFGCQQESAPSISWLLMAAIFLLWTLGGHIDVKLPNRVTRQYSLCGDPDDLTHYRIAVRLEELSRGGSEYIHRFLLPGSLVINLHPTAAAPFPLKCCLEECTSLVASASPQSWRCSCETTCLA